MTSKFIYHLLKLDAHTASLIFQKHFTYRNTINHVVNYRVIKYHTLHYIKFCMFCYNMHVKMQPI